MNEIDARNVLLLRAFESPVEPPWSDVEADAASREASRDVGESASEDAFISRRAAIATSRLARLDSTATTTTTLEFGASAIDRHLAVVALVVAFGIGVASDSVASDGRINLLAPPLLGLIVWNLAVYAALLIAWLQRGHRPTRHPSLDLLIDKLKRSTMTARRAAKGPWLRFARDWADASRPLHAQRIGTLLHAGAVAVAVGALASLYVRGLVFEYRAGWDSTFLTPTAVHAWLSTLLGPASKLTGIDVPDVNALAALRFSTGTGENAARWIHLYAVTVLALVVWPRGWLAAAALRRARRLAADFPIDLRDPYFQRLLRGRGGVSLNCGLLPYSHQPTTGHIDRLARLVESVSGQRVIMRSLAPVAQGDEDDAAQLGARLDGHHSLLLVLFTLTATPERETHGRLLDTLRSIDPRRPVIVLVDETAFAQRFAMTTPNRVSERRAAWQRMSNDVGMTPVFIDFDTQSTAMNEAAFGVAFEATAGSVR